MERKLHLNELKAIYMQESKCLDNNKSNFEQVLTEREKIFHVIEKTVSAVKEGKKL